MQVLKQVNELPTPTWNHLEINGIDIEVPVAEGAAEVVEGRFEGATCEPPVGGAGGQAQAWLEAAAGEVCRVEVPAGEVADEPIVVDMAQVARAAFVLDVVVGAGALPLRRSAPRAAGACASRWKRAPGSTSSPWWHATPPRCSTTWVWWRRRARACT